MHNSGAPRRESAGLYLRLFENWIEKHDHGHRPRRRAIQYSSEPCDYPRRRGVPDAPPEPVIGLAGGEARRRGMTESI